MKAIDNPSLMSQQTYLLTIINNTSKYQDHNNRCH